MKKVPPLLFLLPHSPDFLLILFLKLARFPLLLYNKCLLLESVIPPLPECWPASTHSMSAPILPLSLCIFPSPCVSSLSISFFSLSYCLSIHPLPLAVCLFLPQTAATVIWSCRQCVTSRRGWTSCRLRPNSPGRSSSLSIEASRTYVRLLRPPSLLWLHYNALYRLELFWYMRLSLPPSLEQECPSGMVDEETFKTIYSQFFPQGG